MSDSLDDLFARYGPAYRWLATVTVLIAFFTMALSATIANVAVPDVMGAFGVGQDKAQFVTTAFFATMTASQLLITWFNERLGQRLTFSLALLIFAGGSAISGFGPTLEFIIAGRIFQGFSAGILQSLVMLLLIQIFPPERRGLAMGLFSMGIVVALGVGPFVGGLAIDNMSWRYIFLVPMPLALLAFVMGWLFIPSSRSRARVTRFDALGYALLCTALFCLMTAVANGQRDGWHSNGILALFTVTIAASGGFILSQFRPNAGLLDMTLFRNARFVSAVAVASVFGMGNFATIYVFPVFGQLVQEYTATLAGFLILPGSLVAAAILPLSGRLSDRHPPQYLIIFGLGLFSLSMFMMAGTDIDTRVWTVVIFIFIGRLGLALVVPSMNGAALGSLPPGKLTEGTGALNFFLLLGGAFGVNTLVVIMEQRTQFHSDLLAATQTAGNATTREMLDSVQGLLGAAGVPRSMHNSVALDYLGKVVHAQANTMGFQDGFVAIGLVFLVAMIPATILGWTLRRANKLN